MARLTAESYRIQDWPRDPWIEAVWTNPKQEIIDLFIEAHRLGISIDVVGLGYFYPWDIRIERGENVVLIVQGRGRPR